MGDACNRGERGHEDETYNAHRKTPDRQLSQKEVQRPYQRKADIRRALHRGCAEREVRATTVALRLAVVGELREHRVHLVRRKQRGSPICSARQYISASVSTSTASASAASSDGRSRSCRGCDSRHARRPSSARDRMVGQRLRAERRVGRAADVVAARDGDHVVERGNAAVEARERRCERRMRMHDRLRVVARRVDVAMKSPFRSTAAARRCACVRRCATATISSALISRVGHPARRDQKPVEVPSRQRALTLPDLPRLMPSAFISSAVAMTASRNAVANQRDWSSRRARETSRRSQSRVARATPRSVRGR